MKRQLRVAAVILVNQGAVLLARRAPGRSHPGLWELPGGKLEPNESVIAAARREILEELGIRVKDPYLFMTYTWENEDVSIILTAVRGIPVPLPRASIDHDKLLWVPLSGLKEFLDRAKSEVTQPDIIVLRVLEAQNLKNIRDL